MSTSFRLECDHCKTSLFSTSYTWNLSPMFNEAGVLDALKVGGKKGHEIANVLFAGAVRMRARPEHFKAFNPPNGWGSYESALRLLDEIIRAALMWPDCVTVVDGRRGD